MNILRSYIRLVFQQALFVFVLSCLVSTPHPAVYSVISHQLNGVLHLKWIMCQCLFCRCRVCCGALSGIWIWCLTPLQLDWFRVSSICLVSTHQMSMISIHIMNAMDFSHDALFLMQHQSHREQQ